MTTEPQRHPPPPAFLTTRWTRVCLAKADSTDGRAALADLCAAYYEPVAAYLRGFLRESELAREMTQAFFAGILSGGCIDSADESRGRFRSYLLGAVKHFVARQREAASRLKRGGGAAPVALKDEEAAGVPDARLLPPDAEFDRQWACTVIARSMAALRSQSVEEGRGQFFDVVAGILHGHADHGEQTALAASCGMNGDAFRMAISRLKKRLRQCVKDEVAGTLRDPAGVQAEMQALFAALSG